MRHLLLAALLVGTTFGQGQTSSVEHPLTPSPIPQTPAEARKFDSSAPQICVEVRYLSGSPEAMKQLTAGDLIRTAPAKKPPVPTSIQDAQLRANNGIQLVSATRVIEERQPVFVRRLDDKQAFRLLEIDQKDERVSILFAPKVTLFDGQTADINDTVQRPFVVGLSKEPTEPGGLKPNIEVMDEGSSIKVRAAIKPEGVRLDLAIDMSQITNVGTKNAGPENVSVQVPRVSAARVSLSAMVPDGGTLAIGGLERTVEVRKEKRVLGVFKNVSVGRTTENMIVLVTPRIIVPDEELVLGEIISQADRPRQTTRRRTR